MCVYVYIHIHMFLSLGRDYLSNATCLIRPHLSCVVRRVKDHRKLPKYSPLLKKTCVRQVVLDKWFPSSLAPVFAMIPEADP